MLSRLWCATICNNGDNILIGGIGYNLAKEDMLSLGISALALHKMFLNAVTIRY